MQASRKTRRPEARERAATHARREKGEEGQDAQTVAGLSLHPRGGLSGRSVAATIPRGPPSRGEREKLMRMFQEQRARRRQELAKHLAKHPRDPNAHFELGQLYALDGHIEKGIREYRTVTQIVPDHVTAYFNLGILYHRSGQLEQAIETFREVLRLDPTDLPTHINLGGVYRDRRGALLQKEIEILEGAVNLRPDYPEAHYHLGTAYRAMGDRSPDCRPWYKKAQAELQAYLTARPSGKRHQAVSRWVKILGERLEDC